MSSRAYFLALLLVMPLIGHAGLQDWLNKLPDVPTPTDATATPAASLSETDMTAALKQALDKATVYAVDQLGKTGGFLDNPRVRIPLPDHLDWIATSLRRVGQDRLADDFVTTLNRAAERAVPEALEQFRQAISAMSVADARDIVTGPDDAATQYFRRTSEAQLRDRFLPIVRATTQQTGATAAYKSMQSRAGGITGLVNQDTFDIDRYVTDKTLDGLFLMVAEEEQRIRNNPLARSTELLKKVFGAVDR